MPAGYYRFPTIYDETVVFVCEDDLWTVPACGGIARRLTSNLGEATRPFLSPDGTQLAFVGREEGQPEIYVMPAIGGPAQRLTFMGGTQCQTVGWTRDGKIIFANNAAQPFPRMTYLYTIDLEGNPPEQLKVGPAQTIAFGPDGASVIGRNTGDPARWKRYRGGTTGQLWIDAEGDGSYRPLLKLDGNFASPMWIGERIYFLSDHEGIGNLYSCLPSGGDVRRHTHHDMFYARNPTTDGKRIVYHAGADLYAFDPLTNESRLIAIEFHSPQTQRKRKFVDTAKYLHDWELHPQGHSTAITARGKLFAFPNWEGAVLQLGSGHGTRYRLPQWLNDGRRLIALSDEGGEESFVILHADGSAEPERLSDFDIGRPDEIHVNPKRDQIAFSNHRHELMLFDLETRQLQRIDRGKSERIGGFAWSPDGAWLAYSVSVSLQVMTLKLWKAETGEIFALTKAVLRDVNPAFDPEGKYLYFVSYRHFDPVYDNLHFDLGFPRGVKPYLITLQKDSPSPFVPLPKTAKEEKANKADESAKTDAAEKEKPAEKPTQIDLDGIESRVVAFPVEEGRYARIKGIKGKALYVRYPVEGALTQSLFPGQPSAKGTLCVYDLEEQKEEVLVNGVTDFKLSRDATTLIYRAGGRLRALKAGDKPNEQNGDAPGRKSGWIDLNRVKVSVDPALEWRQMFREAWRLQRDHFWTSDMSQVDWLRVYNCYLPLVERVASRSEFSDLVWELQGELGTSHAYELGGDYRPEPEYRVGYLGADFAYDEVSDAWRIMRIVQGDPWDEKRNSPLARPGVNVKEGDCLIAIGGRRLSRTIPPLAALVNLAETEVVLTVQSDGEAPRNVIVKTLADETPVRYREWVERNRRRVHEATNGCVGYVHIPDMGARGYAEFHRGYLAEIDREGLIVDIRYNGGGHVSPLILEKLARRRIGYDISRWSEQPIPFPPDSVLGPIVTLTNEHAGSDGDIFSHGFKLMKLGPLLGKRTWGGVIGISPSQTLVDGTVTTQPEYSFWFSDVGWGVENYGTDPDIEVDNTPQDYARGVDAQLERTIAEIMKLLEVNPPQLPSFDQRPSRALPTLPKLSSTAEPADG